jgi:hypothetical protein
MTQRNHVIADLIRNSESRLKTGCRIKRGMTKIPASMHTCVVSVAIAFGFAWVVAVSLVMAEWLPSNSFLYR